MGKVFKNGNSIAVTIPKAYAHQLSIRDGSRIEWKKIDRGLLLKHTIDPKAAGVTPKFAKMVDDFISEHEDVLQELSHR